MLLVESFEDKKKPKYYIECGMEKFGISIEHPMSCWYFYFVVVHVHFVGLKYFASLIDRLVSTATEKDGRQTNASCGKSCIVGYIHIIIFVTLWIENCTPTPLLHSPHLFSLLSLSLASFWSKLKMCKRKKNKIKRLRFELHSPIFIRLAQECHKIEDI